MRTLAAILSRQYVPLRLRTKSSNTRRLYDIALANFARSLGRTPKLSDLTDAKLSDLADWHLARGNSPATANRDVGNLLALWRWAAQRKMVGRWPEIELLPEPVDEPQAWLKHELATLWQAIRAVDGSIDGVRARDWWLALHCCLWDSGERIGAMLQARWTWLDERNGWLSVPASARKGKRHGRMYRLHADTLAALVAIKKPQREQIFPWPWSYTYIWDRYGKDILAPAGLPTNRKCKFHRIRKSVASFSEAAGVDACKLLGHSNQRVTAVYLDPRIVAPPQPSQVLFRPDAGC